MRHALLEDRSIIAVSGDDAESLLNRLFTNSVLGMKPGVARYAALLSPQGKLLVDFLVFRRPDGFWLDVPRLQAAELVKKLILFKLRAKATIEDKSGELAVGASWDGVLMKAPGPAFRDPRHNDLGYRVVAPRQTLDADPDGAPSYATHRINFGVPRGGTDFVYGDAFVHDANLDLLHGVDFDKGCYVGQEVVSRVHHRGSARKRVVKLTFYGHPPAIGTALLAGATQIGQVTSIADREGLAPARIDRLAEAEATNAPILAGETLVGITLPGKSLVAPPSYAEDVL